MPLGMLAAAMPRFAWVTLLVAATVATAAAGLDHERNPVRRRPPPAEVRGAAQRLIVKLRDLPALPAAATTEPRVRLIALADRAGLALESHRSITAELHVMQLAPSAASAQETLARLRADPEVVYAELDQRRFIHQVPPSDPLYAATQTWPGQWYLMPSSPATPSAIDAQTAWNTTQGLAGLVIADIDTGVRYDHPDLLAVGQPGGRLLPGYCFILDAFVADHNAAGNTCPGPDASDPGDWVAQADLSAAECVNAGVKQTSNSTWHGTRVAGILAAIANNSPTPLGIAGVTWDTQILPVRALGVCGGQDSDIITGMLWAAGFAVRVNNVPVPANPHPARIINMSLGGAGSCPASYQDVINQITAKGILIVASVGNEGGQVDAPANCPGVAGIAGLRQAGTKVGFSSLGTEVALGAPAGNCVNANPGATVPCDYPITTTTNLGTQGPDANDYTGLYLCGPNSTATTCAAGATTSTQYRTWNLGTSFAAPQVAGIGALMLAANGNLNSCQMIARLKEGAVQYPQTSVGESPQPPACHVPVSASDLQPAECICTLDGQTCGAGMASASGALAAALRPIAAVAAPPAALATGQVVQLSGKGSAAAPPHMITTYAWRQLSGTPLTLQNASSSSASVTLPSCGIGTVALTVTDDAGRQDTADVVVTPTTVTTSAPATAGQTSCSVTPPAIQVAVCPGSGSVQAGGGTQDFVATVANTTSTAVTWLVDGIDGGNATVGTISSSGVYNAPAAPPAGGRVTVSAVSVSDASATASAQLTITAPPGSGGGGGGGELDWLTLLCGGALATALVRRRSRLEA